jgi:hypothetical protein
MTEQINQYLNQISQNTETIAENQQKVYDAGRTAGKMEDVDYSDGYKDGYVAGAGSFNREVIDSILNGETPVGKAIEADKATTATYAVAAGQAEQATHADAATHATTADSATNADNATNALRANSANAAENASKADYATEAGHAATATSATSATYAEQADTADFAQVASRASAAYATGTVSAVSKPISVGGNTLVYYIISIALDIPPKLLVLVQNETTIICMQGKYVYALSGESYSGNTSYADGTFSMTLPSGDPVGLGSGSWSYVAIM